MKDHIAIVDKARQAIMSIKADIRMLDEAVVPIDVAKQRVEVFIDNLASTFEDFIQPHYFIEQKDLSGHIDFTGKPIIDQFIAWLCRDKLIEMITARVAEHHKSIGRQVLNSADVAPKREALKQKLFDAEVAEERVLCEAEASGFQVIRRRDADAKAILAAAD